MDEVLKFGECYICLEETPLMSQCSCIDRYLCENCEEKLRIYNYKYCTVCKDVYPKFQKIIDIEVNIEPVEESGYTLCCFRNQRQRHQPKYCFFDMLVHIFCTYVIMIVISCSVNLNNHCYSWGAIYYLFPALVIYFIVCAFLVSCRRVY